MNRICKPVLSEHDTCTEFSRQIFYNWAKEDVGKIFLRNEKHAKKAIFTFSPNSIFIMVNENNMLLNYLSK